MAQSQTLSSTGSHRLIAVPWYILLWVSDQPPLRDACFAAHDFVGGSIITPSSHLAISAARLVVLPLCFMAAPRCQHSTSFSLTNFALTMRKPKCNHIADFAPFSIFSGLSSFKFVSDFCQLRQRWRLSSLFPWFWHDANNNNNENSHKTLQKNTQLKLWPTWLVYRWDVPNITVAKSIVISSKTYRGYNIDAAIYHYSPAIELRSTSR